MSYKETVLEALGKAKTLDDFDYIAEKIKVTDKINRHTKAGRELTDELLSLLQTKRNEAINKYNIQPF